MPKPAPSPFADLAALHAYLAATAGRPCEPGVDELDHALQCAHELKALAPDDEELQIAGLVHDIAHSLCPIGIHADIGGQIVGGVLGARVAGLAGLHVDAKRYLVARDAQYRARLSPVSIRTLLAQGGPMGDAQADAFETRPHWRDALLLRRADDAAKVPGRAVPGLETWLPALRRVGGLRACAKTFMRERTADRETGLAENQPDIDRIA